MLRRPRFYKANMPLVLGIIVLGQKKFAYGSKHKNFRAMLIGGTKNSLATSHIKICILTTFMARMERSV